MGGLTDVVIPCRGDQDTVYKNIQAFREHPKIGNIFVVWNGQDSYSFLADGSALHLMCLDADGKGQAVNFGLNYVETERVIFCDADLTGLKTKHVDILTRPHRGMVLGVPNRPERMPVPWPVSAGTWAWMTGERSLPTWVPRSLDLHGYAMEAQINRAILEADLPVQVMRLEGVTGKVRQNKQRMAELRRDREWWNQQHP